MTYFFQNYDNIISYQSVLTPNYFVNDFISWITKWPLFIGEDVVELWKSHYKSA